MLFNLESFAHLLRSPATWGSSHRSQAPGKTLVIGASYIALESAPAQPQGVLSSWVPDSSNTTVFKANDMDRE